MLEAPTVEAFKVCAYKFVFDEFAQKKFQMQLAEGLHDNIGNAN